MVSSKMIELQKNYHAVQSQNINIHDYPQSDFDVLFDIISAETFISGSVDKLLSGSSVSFEERNMLSQQLLHNNEWMTQDTGLVLISNPDILSYAVLLENFRKSCVDYLMSREN